MKDNQNVKIIRFEDLVLNPEKIITDLCKFLEVEYLPTMLEIAHLGSSANKDQPHVKGINSAISGQWMHGGLNRAEIAICTDINKAEFAANGYPADDLKRVIPGVFLYYLTFPFKTGLALMLNWKRMRNIKETIKRRLA